MNIHKKRLLDLQSLLRRKNLDAMVLSRLLEQRYLTGYGVEGYTLLVSRDEAWVFLPKMFLEQFKSLVDFVAPLAPENQLEAVLAKIKEKKLKKVVFEPETETYTRGKFWAEKGFTEFTGLTATLRSTKEGEELANVRKACKIAALAFTAIKPRIKTGRTEISVMNELNDIMRSHGASGPSFNLIIGFGANSALPHHISSDRVLKNNEAVLLDFGCVYNGYCSDITRTYFHGKPDAEFLKVYAIVDAAQKAGVKKVKNGVDSYEIDKACRTHISDRGYGQYFIHGTGHGVGLEIHEYPMVNAKTKAVLETGMAITVEPGIYLNGKFGVRVEDTVLVTNKGSEVLTK